MSGEADSSFSKHFLQDRVSYQRHMAEEHSSGEHPFFCQICNVYLKCEAAFKSHNSKLHLERRAKMFYCRQCDETFSCKLRHTDHIATHRTWSDDDQGLQCKVCGKVFSKTQIMGYQKHLSTHDEEVDVVRMILNYIIVYSVLSLGRISRSMFFSQGFYRLKTCLHLLREM